MLSRNFETAAETLGPEMASVKLFHLHQRNEPGQPTSSIRAFIAHRRLRLGTFRDRLL
jgi:hypothetical protein